MKKTAPFKLAIAPKLTFFNSQLSDLNMLRMQVNRSKGLATYLAQSQKAQRSLTALNSTLSIMSFSIYMVRLMNNLSLLALMLSEEEQKSRKLRGTLYLNLFNDSLWSIVNLTQCFWLSFRNSKAAGLQGMQLEVIAQLIDLLVMLIRYQQEKEEYELKYMQANSIERNHLQMDRFYKEMHFIRSILTSLSIVTVISVFAFSVASVSISPIISPIILLNSLSKLFIDNEKEKYLLHQMSYRLTEEQLLNKERALRRKYFTALNQIILYNVLLPIGLFTLIITPIPLAILISLSMLLTHLLTQRLIEAHYKPIANENNEGIDIESRLTV